jgi:hypothetical protein
MSKEKLGSPRYPTKAREKAIRLIWELYDA